MKKNVCSPDSIRPCTGCGMCSSACNFNAIAITETSDGFFSPCIDEAKCTGCAACTKVCYKFDSSFSVKETEDHDCFSATNKNEIELFSASSGAVSIELMRECLTRGYHVVGVAYDINLNRAVTKIARTPCELEQFKGSKYFQSFTSDAFRAVSKDKSEQKYAIFGTPCQIYAFSKMAELSKSRSKYIFVDIFCHGCPSLKVWDKYLEYIKSKTEFDRFDRINFRSKSHGWHEYAFDFVRGTEQFTSSKLDDPFHELFFSMDTMNEACYDCIARSTVEKTDLRIGDFWGKRYNTDSKGVSAVVISSELGRDLFFSIADKFKIEKADFDEIICAQSYKKTHKFDTERRRKVFELLSGNEQIQLIVKKRRKMLSPKSNMKRLAKNALKHLPASVYLKLKNKLG